MHEDPFKNRNNFIKARAELDAGDYIRLMEKRSKSFEFQPSGEVILNAEESEEILSHAKRMYNLNVKEIARYFVSLADAVKQILLERNLQ